MYFGGSLTGASLHHAVHDDGVCGKDRDSHDNKFTHTHSYADIYYIYTILTIDNILFRSRQFVSQKAHDAFYPHVACQRLQSSED